MVQHAFHSRVFPNCSLSTGKVETEVPKCAEEPVDQKVVLDAVLCWDVDTGVRFIHSHHELQWSKSAQWFEAVCHFAVGCAGGRGWSSGPFVIEFSNSAVTVPSREFQGKCGIN